MTKDEIQRKIDHFNALAEGYDMVAEEFIASAHKFKGEALNKHFKETITYMHNKHFYRGKADAYIDIYNSMFPEMEGKRAFPLDEKAYNDVKEHVKQITQYTIPS